jgi:hypothetical protein
LYSGSWAMSFTENRSVSVDATSTVRVWERFVASMVG